MKIILTGASGYIGSKVIRRLLIEKHKVYSIIRPSSKMNLLDDIKDQITFIYDNGSVEDIAQHFKAIKADVVIHIASLFLAEHTISNIDQLLQSNIIFATHILEAMEQSGTKKIITTTTSWEHFNNELYNPVCLYSATKKAFEDILQYYVEAKKFSAQILTIYDTYGIDDPRNKIINLFKRISQTGETLNMSPGEQRLDLIYIDDIVDAYLCALNNFTKDDVSTLKKYYLRSNNDMKLKDIAELYSKINNVSLNINWGKRSYRLREVMDTYKEGEILPGWIPKVTLEEGFKKIG
jgi:nucleoside-diphosphate-sugar epimerase